MRLKHILITLSFIAFMGVIAFYAVAYIGSEKGKWQKREIYGREVLYPLISGDLPEMGTTVTELAGGVLIIVDAESSTVIALSPKDPYEGCDPGARVMLVRDYRRAYNEKYYCRPGLR